MITLNPYDMHVTYVRTARRSTGQKFYRTYFETMPYGKISQKPHKTATDALQYGIAVVKRWKRLLAARPQPEQA